MKLPVTAVVVAGTTVLADGWGNVGIAALVGTKHLMSNLLVFLCFFCDLFVSILLLFVGLVFLFKKGDRTQAGVKGFSIPLFSSMNIFIFLSTEEKVLPAYPMDCKQKTVWSNTF